MDFARFEADDHLVIRGRENLQFFLRFEHTAEECSEYVITAYAKLFPTDEDCTCLDDDENLCKCNWNFELTSTHPSCPQTCIEDILRRIANVRACTTCERTHTRYGEHTQCGSCFLQQLFDAELPVALNCPVCYEDVKETRVYTFATCRHQVCVACHAKLVRPKRCPMCRAAADPDD